MGNSARRTLDGLVRNRLIAPGSLYLITPACPPAGDLACFLPRVLEAGVDAVQLREKEMAPGELARYCSTVRRLTASFGAAFILNDYVGLASDCGADGVHLGQDDTPPGRAREMLGPNAIIGWSTHARSEIDAAAGIPVDYLGVGPVYETPTKPGRAAAGHALVRYAAANAARPFFAIGGIDLSTIGPVVEAGATRVAVLRALTEAADPAAVARAIKSLLASAC